MLSTKSLSQIIDELDFSSLSSGNAVLLGKSHWYISKAESEMYKKSHKKVGLSTVSTEFDHEVGQNVVRWWVTKKENDLNELYKRTKYTLVFLEKLKNESRSYRQQYSFTSCQNLIDDLKKFTETNSDAIKRFYKYVKWLYEKDVLAPTILQHYPLWSGSIRNDNLLQLTTNSLEETFSTIDTCTKIVLGLVTTHGTVISYMAREQCVDLDPTEVSPTDLNPIDPTVQNRILAIGVNQSVQKFASYFELMRNSLHFILNEINQYFIDQLHLYDEKFWINFIEKAKDDNNIERKIWDFKETFSMWKVEKSNSKLYETSKVDFAKNIACYANSDGGILVIGISESPREVKGIDDIENKIKTIAPTIKEKIDYDKDFFQIIPLKIKDSLQRSKDCIVIVISQTAIPVGVESDGSYTYTIRNEIECISEKRSKIEKQKTGIVRDNFDFIKNIEQFSIKTK